ncbi:MAG: toprim domain-containing protein, partial [Candidatus Cloacimonadales bacterium]
RDTVAPGEDVLITEGIADAITAHQAGYACLSPVTTSFKISDRERLAELLEAEDVGRVYIVNDAEPPTSSLRDAEDAEGWDRLHVEQYGEGVRGAVRTASYLAEQGINARIGELPQPAAEKVDLDDQKLSK